MIVFDVGNAVDVLSYIILCYVILLLRCFADGSSTHPGTRITGTTNQSIAACSGRKARVSASAARFTEKSSLSLVHDARCERRLQRASS